MTLTHPHLTTTPLAVVVPLVVRRGVFVRRRLRRATAA
jgi:hypothetical protein